MSAFQALLIGILYWIPWTRFGYTFQHIFRQPLSLALFIGLIMGDVPNAIIYGASLNLIYMGLIAAGANIPADEALAACIAIPIALTTNMSPEMAVALAVPVGVLGVFLDQVRRTLNSIWVQMADKYAETANIAGILRCAWLWPPLLQVVLRIPIVFLAGLYGSEAVGAFMNSIPKWLVHAFEVTGGMLPALGFAITIMVIGKRNLLPYFVAGFFLVKYANIPTMAAAIFGVCIALLHIQLAPQKGGVDA